MTEMPNNARSRATWLREGLLLLGFVLLVAAAVATVAVPEMSEDEDGDTVDRSAAASDGGVR